MQIFWKLITALFVFSVIYLFNPLKIENFMPIFNSGLDQNPKLSTNFR